MNNIEEKEKITVGSLFAGIGGIELGLERTGGFKTIWQVENNPYCTKVLEKHWPRVRRYGDVRRIGKVANTESRRRAKQQTSDYRREGRGKTQKLVSIGTSGRSGNGDSSTRAKIHRGTSSKISEETLPYVDFICGGFPCQPVSQAGKRKAQADERWLWPEFIRIVRMVRPRYVLVENVPGLLSANEGTAMGEVLGDLAESGYNAEWNRVSASSVGAPHRRERIFIVAYPKHGFNSNQKRGKSQEKGISQIQDRKDYNRTWKPSGTDELDRGQRETSTNNPIEELAYTDDSGHVHGQTEKLTAETRIDAQRESESSGEDVADTEKVHAQRLFDRQREGQFGRSGWWSVEPDVGRVAHGVPSRVDRLKCLGNAVVPQVAEAVGYMILEFDKNDNHRTGRIQTPQGDLGEVGIFGVF